MTTSHQDIATRRTWAAQICMLSEDRGPLMTSDVIRCFGATKGAANGRLKSIAKKKMMTISRNENGVIYTAVPNWREIAGYSVANISRVEFIAPPLDGPIRPAQKGKALGGELRKLIGAAGVVTSAYVAKELGITSCGAIARLRSAVKLGILVVSNDVRPREYRAADGWQEAAAAADIAAAASAEARMVAARLARHSKTNRESVYATRTRHLDPPSETVRMGAWGWVRISQGSAV